MRSRLAERVASPAAAARTDGKGGALEAILRTFSQSSQYNWTDVVREYLSMESRGEFKLSGCQNYSPVRRNPLFWPQSRVLTMDDQYDIRTRLRLTHLACP